MDSPLPTAHIGRRQSSRQGANVIKSVLFWRVTVHQDNASVGFYMQKQQGQVFRHASYAVVYNASTSKSLTSHRKRTGRTSQHTVFSRSPPPLDQTRLQLALAASVASTLLKTQKHAVT